jgi:hypothetical protein
VQAPPDLGELQDLQVLQDLTVWVQQDQKDYQDLLVIKEIPDRQDPQASQVLRAQLDLKGIQDLPVL